ncbi:MAG TPA: hypothetical protein VH912_22605 [Streptosporangiaceae bacterium]|jgi:hypothetical protein
MSPHQVRIARDRGVAMVEYLGLLALLASIFIAFSSCASQQVKKRAPALDRSMLQKDTQAAIEGARKALQDDDCNNAISGPAGDARDVLDYVAMQDYSTFDAPKGQLADSRGRGARGKITFYGAFHRTQPNRFYYPGAVFKDGRTDLTPEEFQIMAVLHEVGHSTGVHPKEPPGEPGAPFNEAILRRCLGVIQ